MSARSLPEDLTPLPTMPYHERPLSVPLNVDECRTAIWRANGNITVAAKLLKVPSLRMRRFVNNSPFLKAEVDEAAEQLVDKAEQVIAEALDDKEDTGRRDAAARLVLQSRGKGRGWGTGSTSSVNINNNVSGNIVIQWGDGSDINQDKVIDHE